MIKERREKMKNKQAIKMVEQQFEEAKRWQHILQDTQSDEDFKQATLGIHAMGIVLELAKKQVEEFEE